MGALSLLVLTMAVAHSVQGAGGNGPILSSVHAGVAASDASRPDFVPGEILVKLRDTAASAVALQSFPATSQGASARLASAVGAFGSFSQRHGVVSTQLLFQEDEGASATTTPQASKAFPNRVASVQSAYPLRSLRAAASARAPRLDNIYKIRLANHGEDIQAACRELAADPAVEYAVPNHIAYTSAVPNDPLFAQQWAHTVTSTVQAWDIERGNNSVIVAVIDTGVDYTHEDLAANIVRSGSAGGPGIGGYDFVDIDVAAYAASGLKPIVGEDYTTVDNDPMDFNGHGTHCSGIVAATADNGLGVSGVAPGALVMPVRAGFSIMYGSSECGVLESSAIANAIRYATDHGADIISMSFGGREDPVQRDAVAYAASMGVVLVAAAGNDSSSLFAYPANLPAVISVAATNLSGNRASYSNFGAWVDVAAPGGDYTAGGMILSTVPRVGGAICDPSGYRALQGTSMATPYVAGVAALMLSHNPELTPAQVEQIMKRSADQANSKEYIGSGQINTLKALSLQPLAARIIIDSPLSPSRVAAAMVPIIGTIDGSGAGAYRVYYGAGIYPSDWKLIGSGSAPVSNATLAQFDTTSLPSDGTYTIKVVVDANGDSLSQTTHLFVDHGARAGWPIKLDPRFDGLFTDWTGGMVLSDLDNDGRAEIVARSIDKLYVLKSDGSPAAGWPQILPLGGLAFGLSVAPSVGDIDGDGRKEIVVLSGAILSVYSAQGVMRNGFPVNLGRTVDPWDLTGIGSPVLLADLDNDGQMEIVFKLTSCAASIMERIEVYKADGTRYMNWPFLFDAAHGTGGREISFTHLAAFDIDNDGKKEIVGLGRRFINPPPPLAEHQAALYVWNYNGSLRSGYPLELPATYNLGYDNGVSPTVVDIDGDGKMEIGVVNDEGSSVTGSGNFSYYKLNGVAVQGWPVPFQNQLFANASVGDINNDGELETVFGTINGPGASDVYAFRRDGSLLPGWPISVPCGFVSEVIIADVDGDGVSEIVAATGAFMRIGEGAVYAWKAFGALAAGFPKYTQIDGLLMNGVNASLAVGDIDGNGKSELVALCVNGEMYVWNLTSSAIQPRLSWPMALHDPQQSMDVRGVNDRKVITLPGRIQAEDYDLGGEGSGYHDATKGNAGGQYRSEDVDIEACADSGSGYNLGWTDAGEWLNYRVNVINTGKYTFTARLASAAPGTKSMNISLDGNPIGTFSFSDASGWQSWRDVTLSNVSLTAGTHSLRMTMNTSGLNVNYVEAQPQPNVPPVANAGPDLSVAVNALVTLDGRLSYDPDSGPSSLSIAWTQLSGPPVTLSGATSSLSPTFRPSVAGSYTFRLTLNDGAAIRTDEVAVAVKDRQYTALPGRIQAEDYTLGGEGVGYHDTTIGNSGGQYRNDNVDIETCADAGGGRDVGWVVAGEWLAYDVTVAQAGNYKLTARVASAVAGTKTLNVMVDGVSKGSISFTANSGWQNWSDQVLGNIALTGGAHELRLVMTTGDFNINYLDVSSADANLISNGDFANGLNSWSAYWASANLGYAINDAQSAKMVISSAGSNPFDIQLFQVVGLAASRTYTLTFTMKSEGRNKPFKMVVEHNGDPWTKYVERQYQSTQAAGTVEAYSLSWTQPTTDATVKIGFHFGTYNTDDVWLDNVVLSSN